MSSFNKQELLKAVEVGDTPFFGEQSKKVLKVIIPILEHLDKKDISVDKDIINKAFDIKTFLVNFAPKDRKTNQPNEDYIKANNLEEYKIFWIDKVYNEDGIEVKKELKKLVKSYTNPIVDEYTKKISLNGEMVKQLEGYISFIRDKLKENNLI